MNRSREGYKIKIPKIKLWPKIVCPECRKTMNIHKSKIKNTIIEGNETWYIFKEKIKFRCGHEFDKASEAQDRGNLNRGNNHKGSSYPIGRVYQGNAGISHKSPMDKGSGKF